MLLLLVILITSLAGFALTLFLTYSLAGSEGNPVAAVLVALAIALLWSRGFLTLERAYLNGRFDQVRRRLLLWGTSLGVEETFLLRLSMAVEVGNPEEVGRCLSIARPLAGAAFAEAWSQGTTARLHGDPTKAVMAFVAGADITLELDRAELLCEAGITLLQGCTGSSPEACRDELKRAIGFSNEVDRLLRETSPGRGRKTRYRYVALLQQTLRALIYLTQGKTEEARRRLNEVASSGRLLPSLRARRLAVACRIESLPVIHALEGEEPFKKEVASIRKSSTLPLLRLRLSEVETQLARAGRKSSGGAGPTSFLFEPLPTSHEESPGEMFEGATDTPDPFLGEALVVDSVESAIADAGDDLIPSPVDEHGQFRLEIPVERDEG